VRISRDLLRYLDNLGDHKPITRRHIKEEMPSMQVLRTIIPTVVTDDELLWYYERHVKEDLDEPATRIRFLILINHFVRIRLDPEFLIAEAVSVHRTTGLTHKNAKTKSLYKMAAECKRFGSESLAPNALKFMEWWKKTGRNTKALLEDHNGNPLAVKVKKGVWRATGTNSVFSTPAAASLYAREHFRNLYMKLLGDE